MIVKLIISIVCVVVLAFFAGFNLDNKCDVNVLFHTFSQAPVFLTIIISFVAGVIVTLPFAFINKSARKGKLEKKIAEKLKKAEIKQKKDSKKAEEKQNSASQSVEKKVTESLEKEPAKEKNENLSEETASSQTETGCPV